MSRLVISLFVLLFLAVPVSAVYSVSSDDYLYEVHYSIFSNGANALIYLSVSAYNPYCPPLLWEATNCTNVTMAEVRWVKEYLLYFDGSQLYLLNFTPALLVNLPVSAPKNVSSVYFEGLRGLAYLNDSWYVNVSVFAYSSKTLDSVNLNYVYRIDIGNFCFERVNISLSNFATKELKNTINGWKIEIPREFLSTYRNGSVVNISYPTADFFIIANVSDESWSPLHPLIVNWTQLPVYFVLKKNGQTKNVTLFYINTTNTINGYWFSDGVRIVNVTICKRATNITTSTTTGIETTPRSNATKTKTKDICGPGFVVLIILSVLLPNKRR